MSWSTLPLAAVAAAALFALFALKARGRQGGGFGAWPFYAKKLLSPPEQVLYFRLVRALPGHIVLAQVQLSRLLEVKKGNGGQGWLNRINRMSADFVVCARDSSVAAVIELDDASHAQPERSTADAKKDHALRSAGIRVVRWQARALPDDATIRACFPANQAPGPGVPPEASRARRPHGSGAGLSLSRP